MIPLWLFAAMDKQLCKAQIAIVSSITIFDSLFLVILIGDFYQFAPISDYILWDLPYSKEKIHKKVLWNNFCLVLFLIKQMQPRSNLVFQAILKYARHGLLIFKDVNSFNTYMENYFSDSNFANTIIIVKKNKRKHLINCL